MVARSEVTFSSFATAHSAGSSADHWELVDAELDKARRRYAFWVRAVEYGLRLARSRVFWWAHGEALKIIKQRQRELNRIVEAEIAFKRRLTA